MTQKLTLIFMSGSRDGEAITLDASGTPPSIFIGRSAPCELVITDDPDLSRRHARISWSGTAWILEDLNSSNGVFFGEFQIERKLAGTIAIKEGDIFRLGLTRLRLDKAGKENVALARAVANAKK